MIAVKIILMTGALFYFVAALAMCYGLAKVKSQQTSVRAPFVSVLIPARNEQKNIRACLESVLNQDYPDYEVIVLNDHSEDKTLDIAREFAKHDSKLKIIDLDSLPPGVAPKKAAIETGVKNSAGEIIVTTDADCIVKKSWLKSLVCLFDNNTGAVLAWLKVIPDGRFFSQVESLDSLFYSFIGAAMVGLGRPVIANGANFAYRKKVFAAVHGFAGLKHYASGDDDLFLQKLARQKKWRVKFQVSLQALVSTAAVQNLGEFISQRVRWASKWPIYPSGLLAGQAGLYLFFLAMVASIFLAIFQPLLFCYFTSALIIKMLSDRLVMAAGQRYVPFRLNGGVFVALEVLHILYILYVGIGGLWGQFTWKGRKFVRGQVIIPKR